MALHTFEIPRRHRQCALGQEDFVPGQSYYSLLEQGKEGYERKDYCPECWKKQLDGSVGHLEGKVFWKSSVPEKQSISEEAKRRDERALDLLKEYSSSDRPEELSQAFILALLLSRNKLLQLKQEVEEEGKTVMLYEVRRTEEMIGVRKLDLSSIQTDLIQTALAEKLGS